jgi:hypothetical protein
MTHLQTLENVPQFQKDQTLESAASLVAINNANGCIYEMPKLLFREDSKALRTPLHAGIARCHKILDGAGYASPNDLLQHHSLLAICKPFLKESTYEHAAARAIEEPRTGKWHLQGLIIAEPFSQRCMYCPDCVARDINELGYGYARRAHQVTEVKFCPEHGTLLLVGEAKTSGYWGERGLVLQGCLVKQDDETTSAGQVIATKRARLNLGRFVAAAFAGELPTVSPSARRVALLARLAQMPRKQGEANSLPHRLEQLVVSSYTERVLENMGLPPYEGVLTRWPALYAAGVAFQEDPFVGLLTCSAVYESPSEYCSAFAFKGIPSPSGRGHPEYYDPRPARPKYAWTLGLIRALLSCESQKAIASKLGIAEATVGDYIDAYDGMRLRRSSILERHGKRHYRKLIHRFVAENRDAKRTAIWRHHRHALEFLMKYDHHWLNDALRPMDEARP